MRRLFPVLLALIAALLSTGGGTATRPNLIIISVDTLRADRLSGYGYSKRTSPSLDRLLGRSAVFTDAITNIPLTNPAFASMFSGLYPHETGAVRNGIPMVDRVPTITMSLKRAGYHTAAILSNWPLQARLSNLHRGFDLYDDDFHEKRWLIFNDERDADGVTRRAAAWLEQGPAEPFFAWIHYSDPHSPYEEHDGFKFGSPLDDGARYDSEVAYTDHHIGKLLEDLQRSGFLDRSYVIFVSDHGESLGEHGYTGHGRDVYQPSLRVPLAVSGPGIRPRRESAPVQLLDLAPTLLELAGLPVPKEMTGMSLAPLLLAGTAPPERTLYYETYPGAAPQVAGSEKILSNPLWVGRKLGPDKLMLDLVRRRWERYDISADAAEAKNLVKLRDGEFVSASDALLGWYREWEDSAVLGKVGAVTEDDVKKFRALGYIDSP